MIMYERYISETRNTIINIDIYTQYNLRSCVFSPVDDGLIKIQSISSKAVGEFRRSTVVCLLYLNSALKNIHAANTKNTTRKHIGNQSDTAERISQEAIIEKW